MANVVTGLAQNSDTTALRSALDAAGLSHEPLQVISGDDSVQPIGSGLTGSSDLFAGDGGTGTGVPGITGTTGATTPGVIGGSGGYFRNEDLADRLADIRIPDSQMDNYVEALERGKTVIAYFAKPETVDAATTAFKNASLANVRVF
jgi:hypothetical protein